MQFFKDIPFPYYNIMQKDIRSFENNESNFSKRLTTPIFSLFLTTPIFYKDRFHSSPGIDVQYRKRETRYGRDNLLSDIARAHIWGRISFKLIHDEETPRLLLLFLLAWKRAVFGNGNIPFRISRVDNRNENAPLRIMTICSALIVIWYFRKVCTRLRFYDVENQTDKRQEFCDIVAAL